MFESLARNKQEKAERAAEGRQHDFVREQTMIQAGGNSQIDSMDLNYQSDKSDLLMWQQDPDEEINILKMQLLGYAKASDGEWRHKTKALASEEFVEAKIVPTVRTFISKVSTNANYSEKRILNMLKFTCDDLVSSMVSSYYNHEIEFENYDIVLRMCKNVMVAGAFRALNGWTKRLDSSVIKRIEAFNENAGVQKSEKKMFGLTG